MDAIDVGLADKTSPTVIKRKSSSVDVVSSTGGDVGLQMQSFANGTVIVEEKSGVDGLYAGDGNGTVTDGTSNGDSGNGGSNGTVSQRASIILDHSNKIQANMQVSQV